METFLFYINQGFFHVLDINALDHVLFFIALTIIYRITQWRKTLWLISFFTLGHSLTFGLSVYDYIEVDVDLVEFFIPITILIPLMLNIIKSVKNEHIEQNNTNIYFALFFGLIHGLGFSNYFKMLLEKGDDKLFPLVSFAIGIEFAQIIIVLIVLTMSYFAINYLKIKAKYWIIGISLIVIIRIIPMLINRYPF